MNPYHKIQTVFKRDPATKHKTLLEGEYSLPEFEFLAQNAWVFTEKVDGTNIRVQFDGENVTFGGRTDRAQIPTYLLERLEARFLPLKAQMAEQFPDGVCLYGEGYGPKIQKVGKLYRNDHDFVLFDVRIGDFWLKRAAVVEVAEALTVDIVPIIGTGTLFDMIEKTRAGFNSIWGDFRAEGIVARPAVELQTRAGERIITKLKCKDFPR